MMEKGDDKDELLSEDESDLDETISDDKLKLKGGKNKSEEGTNSIESRFLIKSRKPVHPSKKESLNKNLHLCIAAGVFVCGLAMAVYAYQSGRSSDLRVPPPFNLRKELKMLRELYPKQEMKFWVNLESCLTRMKEGHGNLCVLLLVHGESDSNSFWPLLRNIGEVSGGYLEIGKNNNPVIVKGEQLKGILLNTTTRPGQPSTTTAEGAAATSGGGGSRFESIVSHYAGWLNQSRILIVNGLEGVPDQILKQFHALCDEENPVIRGLSIFLTLKSDFTNAGTAATSIKRIAELTFSQLWSSIPSNELDPLITRMTVNVVQLKPLH